MFLAGLSYRNFKVLKNTRLPLGRFTLLVGPNGSGKSTALQALRFGASNSPFPNHRRLRLLTGDGSPTLEIEWAEPRGVTTRCEWLEAGSLSRSHKGLPPPSNPTIQSLNAWLERVRYYAFEGQQLAAPVSLQPRMELSANGANLAGVLDRLRDTDPERFGLLNAELAKWIPEFDQVLFDTPRQGVRELLLRVAGGKTGIPASDLSDGTLLALGLLTLAYSTDPPTLVALEEPDRGIHPRLLRRIQDALYRSAYPESHSETRSPVQVIVTTHSPCFLDLFRDHPEEIVVAEKHKGEAQFVPLAEKENLRELLGDAPLGDLWYSGILGGVPIEQ